MIKCLVCKILSKLEQDGSLKELVNSGVIPTTVLLHYEIYLEYDKQKQVSKKNKVTIVSELADKFRVSDITVYRVIKNFEKT